MSGEVRRPAHAERGMASGVRREAAAERGMASGELRRALSAEWLKGRHGAARRVAVAGAVPCALLGILASGALGAAAQPGIGFATYGWAWWYTLMLPVVVSLVCVCVARLDVRGGLRGVLGLPLSPRSTWWAKVLVCLGLVLVSSLVVWAASVPCWLLGGLAPDPLLGLAAALLCTVGAAWMVPACLWLATSCGTLAAIALPVLGQVAVGLVFSYAPIWWALAPAAAFRLCSPVVGVAPSGIPLAPGDPLWAMGAPWAAGVAVCLGAFVLLAWLGARWADRLEGR